MYQITKLCPGNWSIGIYTVSFDQQSVGVCDQSPREVAERRPLRRRLSSSLRVLV
jgi:hypothetical protein